MSGVPLNLQGVIAPPPNLNRASISSLTRQVDRAAGSQKNSPHKKERAAALDEADVELDLDGLDPEATEIQDLEAEIADMREQMDAKERTISGLMERMHSSGTSSKPSSIGLSLVQEATSQVFTAKMECSSVLNRVVATNELLQRLLFQSAEPPASPPPAAPPPPAPLSDTDSEED